MATIISQVDRTQGNYEQVFIYSVNASFNGISGDINSAEIRVFIPDYLEVYLGDVQEPIKSVTETAVVGGREVVYDFGAITDLGIAVRLGLGVSFKIIAENGSTFRLSPKMIINGAEIATGESEEITLTAIAQFEISREIVLPEVEPSAGSAVFYKLTIENFGDLGAAANNLQIVCNGSDIVSIDTDYSVVGKDTSTKFADTTADGIEGSFSGGALTFAIPSYRGQKYEFIYRALIDENLEVGSEVATIANWSIDGITQPDEMHGVTLSEPIYDANISIYAPDYSLPSEYILYRMSIENTGNQILLQTLFENDLPQEIDYYEFKTGSFHVGAINQNLSREYFIDYETANGLSGRIGPYNTDVSSTVNLKNIITVGDNLKVLYWRLESLGIGVGSKAAPELKGIIKADVAMDSTVINHIHLSFDEEGGTSERVENANTLIANFCVLNPSFSSSAGSSPVRPNEEIEFTFEANCRASRLKNPIFAYLMPKELQYVGNEEYIYSDVFEVLTPPQPAVELIPNFNANGDTLVKFEFKDENEYDFSQLAGVKIKFSAKVAVGAYGSITSFLLLNTKGSSGVIPDAVDIYVDDENIAEDSSISRNYAQSGKITNRILYFVSTSSNKKVKGLLDSEYIEEPNVGKTVSGGSLEYLISIKNIGNADLDMVEVVDILPYIGDSGVVEIATPRNSEFPIYALSEVVAVITPEETPVEFEVLYSTSSDPVRFGGNFNIIGSDDNWQSELPEDLSELKSFKVRTKDAVLSPGQTLKIAVTTTVPTAVPTSLVAWNSFAADVVYTNLSGTQEHLLAIEPEKVGVRVEENEAGSVRISGYSWVDTASDGYYTDDEEYVNDVVAVLYDESGKQLRYTSTNTDFAGNDGKYSFENLEAGKYYVKFFIDDKKLKFTTQRLDKENGSKASQSGGMTPLIDLTTQTEANNINVGILAKGKYTLQEILQVNKQARGMMRDVVKNQMLLTMKQEDVIEIIKNS